MVSLFFFGFQAGDHVNVAWLVGASACRRGSCWLGWVGGVPWLWGYAVSSTARRPRVLAGHGNQTPVGPAGLCERLFDCINLANNNKTIYRTIC